MKAYIHHDSTSQSKKKKNDLQKWALVIECLRSLQVIFQRHFQPNELTAF